MNFEYREGNLYRPGKDKPVGWLSECGYKRTQVKGKNYLVHRLIWEMHNGPVPEGMQVDHVDQDRLNNQIGNLRLVTHTDNNRNRGKSPSNTSGFMGVRWDKSSCKWRAQIMVDKKYIHLGRFLNIEDAIQARKEANIKYGFHENHGMRT